MHFLQIEKFVRKKNASIFHVADDKGPTAIAFNCMPTANGPRYTYIHEVSFLVKYEDLEFLADDKDCLCIRVNPLVEFYSLLTGE